MTPYYTVGAAEEKRATPYEIGQISLIWSTAVIVPVTKDLLLSPGSFRHTHRWPHYCLMVRLLSTDGDAMGRT